MRLKNKKVIVALFLTCCILPGYWLWLSLSPVEIVAIHQRLDTTSILVNNFPLTDQGKLNWWLKHKAILQKKYDIPKPSSSGYFTVIFWDFGDGYKKEGKYDRLCFDDMKSPINCIEKEKVFTVSYGKNLGLSFTTDDAIYRMKENGVIVRDESD